MPKGLRVHVTSALDGATAEHVFEDFPVRVGRDPLNELALDHPFVSKFHAVVDVRGGALVLRDLGSRNGTTLETPTDRIPPNHTIELATSNYTFGIGSLTFVVALADVKLDSTSRKRGGAVLSHVPEAWAPVDPGDAHVRTDAGLGGGDSVQRAADAIHADAEIWRASWGKLYSHLSQSLASLNASDRERLTRTVLEANPAIASEPDFQRLASHLGLSASKKGPAPSGTREESIALLVLRDLASWYVDAERPLQTPAQIVAFGRKMQDVLDALFISYVPLRDGLRKPETDADGQASSEPESARASAAVAKTPAELASQLLDWNDAGDSSRTIKRFFADLMVHNVGLVTGVMRGAATLLDQLAPATLERELDADRARGIAALAVGPLRYRALWDSLRKRHEELAGGEKDRVAALFGGDFARTYGALSTDGRAGKTPEGSNGKGERASLPRRTSNPSHASVGEVNGSSAPTSRNDQATRTSAPPPPRRGPMGTEALDEGERIAPPKRDGR